MDRDNVRVRESGGSARFLHESFARSGEACEVHREHFDGDITIQLHVAREVDDSHSPAADLTLEGIFSGEGGLELEEFAGGLRHRRREFAEVLWQGAERITWVNVRILGRSKSKYFMMQSNSAQDIEE
jgi:hypothetical protein